MKERSEKDSGLLMVPSEEKLMAGYDQKRLAS